MRYVPTTLRADCLGTSLVRSATLQLLTATPAPPQRLLQQQQPMQQQQQREAHVLSEALRIAV